MQALQLTRWKQPAEVEEVDVFAPAASGCPAAGRIEGRAVIVPS